MRVQQHRQALTFGREGAIPPRINQRSNGARLKHNRDIPGPSGIGGLQFLPRAAHVALTVRQNDL
jgi:hypothetical protein